MRAWLLWVSGAMLGMSLHACSTTVGEASATSVDAGSDTGVDAAISAAMDASTPADGSVDASGDAEGGALTRYLYIFGSAGSSYRAAVATAGLGPWEEVPSLLVPRSSAAFVMTADGTAVVAGGDVAGGGAFLRTALSTPLASEREWVSANPIPLGRSSLAGTTFESSIFVSGGASANKVPEKNVYATSVVGGIVRTWTVAPDLPKPVYGHAMVTNGMRVFVIGGQDGFALRNDVLAASINPGGELGPWAAVDSLPYVVTSHGAASVGSRIFVIGGVNTNNFSIADVYAGVVVESRIDWSPVTPLPLARANACVTTDGSTIYVLGGFVTSTTVGDSVMIGSVSPSGALTWTTSAPMPVVKVAFGCAVAP